MDRVVLVDTIDNKQLLIFVVFWLFSSCSGVISGDRISYRNSKLYSGEVGAEEGTVKVWAKKMFGQWYQLTAPTRRLRVWVILVYHPDIVALR